LTAEFSAVEARPKGRLSDAVSAEIERRILDGRLKPGDPLPAERDLAKQMAVSRASLREALLKLQARGILEVRRNAGYTIAEATSPSLTDPLLRLMENHPKAVSDVLELRQGLETLTAALAAMRANAEDVDAIREAADRAQSAQLDGDAAAAADWDARFHLAVADASHNVALVHVMRGLFTVMRENVRRAREALFRREDAAEPLHEQHRHLLDAILAHDPEAAVRAAEIHLTFIRDGIRGTDP